MLRIESFHDSHLPQVQSLINCHLASVVPGWALPARFIASRLVCNPGQYVTDPWVVERRTLCALERGRVLGAAHLLRYGAGPEVGGDYSAAGEVAWFLAWPPSPPRRYVFPYSFAEAADALLGAALTQLEGWGVTKQYVSQELYVPVLNGVPEQWPHIARALEAAGFRPAPETEEVVYAGLLSSLPEPPAPPVAGVELRRTTTETLVRFAATLNRVEIGFCEWVLDLSNGGDVPTLAGWVEVADLWVQERWRNRGLASWLVQSGGAWLRLGGLERVVLAVPVSHERGARRFYNRLGWGALTRLERGHARAAAQDSR